MKPSWRQTIRASSLNRHVHAEAYAALVLSGGYEEAGDQGRFRVSAGDVVLHDEFEAHLNRFDGSGAVVLNLRLPQKHSSAWTIARVPDPDCVARLAEKSCADAVGLLLSSAVTWMPQPSDWPDDLAAALVQNPCLRLSDWAEESGLEPWTVSRGFASVFGVSPEAFRARARARQALRLIQSSQEPLAAIAAELGFSDQPHMTRSVKQVTGRSPGAWRSDANGFKTNPRSSL
jgi:AraC-like DNA-binding protein